MRNQYRLRVKKRMESPMLKRRVRVLLMSKKWVTHQKMMKK